MRRAALLGAIALALLAGGAAAADELTLTVVSQTNSTITLGWTPQPGFGYLFSVNGSLVSRTNDPARSSVKFAKVTNGVYEVAVIVKGATGTYPPPAPPPPKAVCANGLDDDQDGKVDYPADPGCSSANDTDETDVVQPPPAGQAFVSPTGNDSAACTQASPCRSWQRGIQAAPAGGTVSAAGGSYGPQSLSGDARGVTLRASGNVTSGRVTIANASNLNIVGPISATGDPNYDYLVRYCNRNVNLAGLTGNVIAIFGADGVTVRDSSFGGYSTSGKSSDSVVSGGDASCGDGWVRNVTLERVTFHDVFYNTPQSQWGGAHPDCFEVNGQVDGLTVRDSIFERCGNTFVGMYTDFGPLKNVTFTGSAFRQMGTQTYYAIQVRGDSPYGCANVVFSGNSILPDNPGALTPYAPPLIMCRTLTSGVPSVTVENNTIQRGNNGCAIEKSAPWNTIYRGNTYPLGGGCD